MMTFSIFWWWMHRTQAAADEGVVDKLGLQGVDTGAAIEHVASIQGVAVGEANRIGASKRSSLEVPFRRSAFSVSMRVLGSPDSPASMLSLAA
ncbi:hypothetical protein DSL92_06100 [Billgrantia gudaonensis]|uniref:Uncharacterized protein n=1 Tax=Billgrantia gudaonensis TaxID=376427 RepID=A0A432JIW4_9GAMM|nr:hypothetical protein DSL92_06100 [Halomonas gudaonensis]